MVDQDTTVQNVDVETKRSPFDWKKTLVLLAGMAVFLAIYFSPPWAVAVDPTGKEFVLSPEGKAAIGLFLMAGIWWIFEVLPIVVTAIAIGVFQALFAIRPAKEAFRDFMDPSVMFIFGSMVVGLAFPPPEPSRRAVGMIPAPAASQTELEP